MKRFLKNYSFLLSLIALILLTLPGILPFFKSGFFSIHDDTQIARTSEMMTSLQDGMFPVRWTENLGYGYGYPIFNYYAPLPYYASGLVGIIGVDALLATKIAFVFASVFAAISMYLFVKEFFGKLPGIVSAIIYFYFPYHAINIYIRGNLNEVFAYSFFPLVLLGFYKLYYLSSSKRLEVLKWCLMTGLSIALITTSHNLSAYMTAVILGILTIIVLVLKRQKKLQFILLLVSAGLIGLGLSAFYWIPVLLEMNYSDVLSQVGGGADYPDHFVCISQYWNSAWGFGGSGPGCLDGMSFKLGKINILITLIALVAGIFLYSTKRLKKYGFLFAGTVAVLGFSLFITTEYSSLLWKVIPRMDFLQFPWRFINFTAIAISVLAAILVYGVQMSIGRILSIVLAAGIIVSAILLQAELFVPQTYYDRGNDYYTNKQFVRWDTSKISDEYMPQGFQVPMSEEEVPLEKIVVNSGNAEISKVTQRTGFVKATVNASTNSEILLTIAPFPAWKIYRENTEIKYKNTNKGIVFSVPKGASEIEARFIQTVVQKIGNGITLITIVGIIWVYMWIKRNEKTKR